jgi:uncharacterized protein YcbK (DUF882 family)
LTLARAGSRLGIAGLFVLIAGNALQSAVAEGDTRTLSFHHVHTGEDITVTFKRDGRYMPEALKQLDWFMRDWRKAQETHMDPRLYDLLWQVYREGGASGPIEIICGYRSPGTNAMLRARSGGVAEYSQHIGGKAIDFFIPGVPLAKIRAMGLQMQRGGVGFYPTSGSPFVHLDVGLVRHWPDISRDELAKIFPDGRTVHIPSDGRPLRNYALALADVEHEGNAPNARSLNAALDAGVISEGQLREAELIAGHPQQEQHRTFIARLFDFGGGEDNADSMMSARQPREPVQVANVSDPKPVAVKPIAVRPAAKLAQRAVPLPEARPQQAEQTIVTAAAKRKPEAQPMRTASLARDVIVQRNVWGDVVATRNIWGDVIARGPGSRDAEHPPETAAAASTSIGSAGGQALAYAAETDPTPVARVRPMGRSVPRLPREASVLPAGPHTTVAVKPPAMTSGGERMDSPWLRAAMLTPSVTGYMTATRLGPANPGWLHDLLHKPENAVLMSFSADPHLGMVADRFTGNAVVFLATATFAPQTTASLR